MAFRRAEEMLERAQEELEQGRRTGTTATGTQQGFSDIQDHGFDDSPPPYDEVYKDEQPPPSYETLGNYGNVPPNSGAIRRSLTTVNEQTTGRITELRAHEGPPSYMVYIPPDRSAPPRRDSISASDAALNISTTLGQMQNYMEEVQERFSDVDLFISSLSLTTPPPS
ncbi:unnamed protein product [Cylicocyclus nassatus]|uniref:Uncharacterized protein n=1 Tax=Cylicocyclus nassatus TaxID=53992 RepID=A0AA36GVD9_CYLNA|nr:unnamed protein product [Cylicocyclus nassatus]